MASEIDQLTVNYEEGGVLLVKELDKVILSRGAWATVLFRYRQWESAKDAYSEDRFTIRRYRKVKGSYMQQSKFNISSVEQAKKIVDALSQWI